MMGEFGGISPTRVALRSRLLRHPWAGTAAGVTFGFVMWVLGGLGSGGGDCRGGGLMCVGSRAPGWLGGGSA
jgi:hypothetical protein